MIKTSLIYLLLGPELGEKEKYQHQIINSLKKEKSKNPEVFKFFPYDINIVDVITLLRNGMLFSDHKVVIIDNIHDLKQGDVNALIDYCENPSAFSTLILCSDRIKAVSSRLEKVVPDENRKIFWELFENQKKGWIVNYFKKYRITLEDDAVEFLVEMVENNTKNLRLECEQLALFFDQGSVIKYADIENFIYHSKEESVFTLGDQILKRDLSGAMQILHKILLSKEDDPLRIINGILWQMRILLSFCSQLDEGYRVDEVFSKLKVKSKRRQKVLLEAKENYEVKELELIIILTAQFEVLLKSMKTELHSLLLELYIYSIIVTGGKAFSHF
jgi:DNA polymerase-3 subunit delta